MLLRGGWLKKFLPHCSRNFQKSKTTTRQSKAPIDYLTTGIPIVGDPVSVGAALIVTLHRPGAVGAPVRQ